MMRSAARVAESGRTTVDEEESAELTESMPVVESDRDAGEPGPAHMESSVWRLAVAGVSGSVLVRFDMMAGCKPTIDCLFEMKDGPWRISEY